MASIENRSRYTVTVKHNDALARTFPFTELEQAQAYSQALRRQGYKPRLRQLEDTILVRIRQKGHKALNYTAQSVEEAEQLVKKIEEERSRGTLYRLHEGAPGHLRRPHPPLHRRGGPEKKGLGEGRAIQMLRLARRPRRRAREARRAAGRRNRGGRLRHHAPQRDAHAGPMTWNG
jgi:hypothetical protein